MRAFCKYFLILFAIVLFCCFFPTQAKADTLPGYTLLDTFNWDSFSSGQWQLGGGQMWGGDSFYGAWDWYDWWLPVPDGYYALSLDTYLRSGYVHAYQSVYRIFDLNKFYTSNSKIRFFMHINAAGLGRQIAAVSFRTFNNGRDVGEGSIGYRTDEAPDPVPSIWPHLYPMTNPLVIRLPNGYRNFAEIPLTFATEPFNQIKVVVYNYNSPSWIYPYAHGPNEIIIDHIMISEGLPQVAVETLTVHPGNLWLDTNGVGSGLVFKATVSELASVTFKVKNSADGSFTTIGEVGTIASGSENVAKLSWWGRKPDGTLIASGECLVMAEVASSNKTATFSVNLVNTNLVGIGKWVKTKDPAAVLPPEATAIACPTTQWDELRLEIAGYLSSIAVGDPVNTSSGNFVFPETDLTLKARLPLVLARIYNSLDSQDKGFGRGWSSPYFSRLEFVASDVIFVNSDGSRLLFSNKNGTYKAPETSELKIALATDTGFWSVSHPNGSEWAFNAEGKIIRMTRACCGMGATDGLLFDYDSNNRLTKVTNPAGQFIQFSYNSENRIVTATDSTGRTLHYSYSNEGNLVTFNDAIGRGTVYQYEEDGFMTSITKPGNRTTFITYVDRRVSLVRNPDGTSSQFTWNFTNPKLSLTDLNGTVHEYEFDNNWRFKSYAVPAVGIAKGFVSSGSAITGYTNSLGDTANYVYGPDGLVRAITNVMGNTTSYEWHPTFHKLTKKTDSLGREWQYFWDAHGNLQMEIDPNGGMASFAHDSHNNRVSKTDQLGRVTRWVYGNSGNYLIQAIDAQGGISSFSYDMRGNLISATDQLGRTTLFSYDLLDRLVKTTFPDGRFTEIEYNQAGNVALRREVGAPLALPVGPPRETWYNYDLADRLTMLTRPDGTIFQYTYNAAGQKISETDSLGRLTRFEYSPVGLLTKTIFPDSSFETFSYDTENRLLSKTNELGQITSFEYNPLGLMLAIIDPTGSRWESQYDRVGRKIADKDPLDRLTGYQFDNLDRITKVIRPDNSFTTSSFDGVGNLLSTVDALGNQWSWVYDNLNRQIGAIQPNGASSSILFDAAGQVISETDTLNRTTRFVFDNGGRRTATKDALGNVWQNIYDNAGRLVAIKDPLGAVSSLTYDIMDRVISQSDPLGNVTGFEFDSAGRRIAKVDAQSRRSITAYDLRDRVSSEVDPEGHTVSYGYNLAGQRVSLTDGANRTWRWEFDNLGRVTAEFDPLGNVNRSSFDSVGNRISSTNARNQTTTYAFDSMNRLSQISYPDSTIATMAYDLEGREISRSGFSGMVTKTWDSVGNMTSETFGPWGKKWQYSFDLAGSRIQAIDPEGQIFKYTVDKLNRLVELDPPDRGDEIKFSFDAAGRPVTEERPGVKTTNTFDMAGRLLEMRHERDHGREKIVALRQYQYNSVGSRISQTDENGEKTFYSFNNSDWLTKAVYPDGIQVSYSYNGAGDRITETTDTPTVKKGGRNTVLGTDTSVIPLAYDAGGRLISRASDTFTFDSDGNQVAAVENGDETRCFWSPDNRLVKVEKDIECPKHGKKKCHQCPQTQTHTVSESYAYLPNDWRRISRTADGKEYVSVFDGADESHEYQLKTRWDKDDDDDDKKEKEKKHIEKVDKKPRLKLIRQFIGGPGTDDLELTRYHGRKLWTLKDGLGSTIALTNRGGNAVARIGYDAFGNLKFPDKPGHGVKPCRDEDLDDLLDRLDGGRSFEFAHDGHHYGRHFGKLVNPYLFTGRKIDTFSNLYNHRNRMMNPRLGRFISKDPIGFKKSINLFRYARNNPLIYTDPFGLLGISIQTNPWVDKYNRWEKPFNFTLEGYSTPPDPNGCPEYFVIQWIRGSAKYNKVPAGWQVPYPLVEMYSQMKPLHFENYQIDSTDRHPIFLTPHNPVIFPRSSNTWTDTIKIQKTLDDSAYPLDADLEFVTALYSVADFKQEFGGTILTPMSNAESYNGLAMHLMFDYPLVRANTAWRLKFSTSSPNNIPIISGESWP